MKSVRPADAEATPVDDVRVVREMIAAEHHGDSAAHRRETLRLFELVRARLGLQRAAPRPAAPAQGETG